jgi:hypothetical protein
MRARLVVLAAVLAVAAVQLSRESGRAVAPLPGEESPRTAPAASRLAPPSPPARFDRDPFRFADEESATHANRAGAPAAPLPSSPEPAPARVRLVGLVRRAGLLRAALMVDGLMVLASPGDTVGGFHVLTLDEEGGVRVRGPEGLEVTLALPEEP